MRNHPHEGVRLSELFVSIRTYSSYHRPVTPIALAGIAAAVLSLVDPVPYIRDILRGMARPHRGTWLIWTALSD